MKRLALVLLLACGPAEAPAPVVVIPPSPPPVATVPQIVDPPPPPPPPPSAPPYRPPPQADAPPADFSDLDAVVKGGKTSVGKVARLYVKRAHYSSGKQFTAEPCSAKGWGSHNVLWLTFKPEQRDYVRPLGAPGDGTTPNAGCADVTFKVTSVGKPPVPLVEGAILRVDNLAPQPAAPGPNGADFATVDDAILAGPEAKGKTVEADLWVYDGNPKELWVHDCKRHDAFVFVLESPTNVDRMVRLRQHSVSRCIRGRLRIEEPDFVLGKTESMQRPRAEIVSFP